MVQELQQQMSQLSGEMQKTTTIIRDYNGLREKVERCEKRIKLSEGQCKGNKDMWGYVVGGIGLLLALLANVRV